MSYTTQLHIKHLTFHSNFLFLCVGVQCIFVGNDGEQLLQTLEQSPAQLKVFDNQFLRLGKALGEAEALVTKWARPLGIRTAARIIKAKLDEEDIKDVSCLFVGDFDRPPT